uniref:UBN2 domain-containing protein n=1 Tax=Manihot esculenta TaxID=3983 RepID=A0A2C9W134_MANES
MDKLEVTYKVTNQVKESKTNLLIHNFELFEMKLPGFEEAELVKKILKSLPKFWEAKTTIIFYTKNFTKYTYDELIGSLIVHEMMLKNNITKKEKSKKGIALKLEKLMDGKKKSITLKINTNNSSSLFNDKEEMAMLVRKFRRYFIKGGNKCWEIRRLIAI